MATPILASYYGIQEFIAHKRARTITGQSRPGEIKSALRPETPQIRLRTGAIYTEANLPQLLKPTTRIFTQIGSRSLLAGAALASYPTIMSLTSWTSMQVYNRAYRITENSTQNRTDLFWAVGIICGIITTSSLPKFTKDVTALSESQAHFYAVSRMATPQTKIGVAMLAGTMGVVAHLVSSLVPDK